MYVNITETRVMTVFDGEIPDPIYDAIEALCKHDRKITAIKLARHIFSEGLRESKLIVEYIAENPRF